MSLPTHPTDFALPSEPTSPAPGHGFEALLALAAQLFQAPQVALFLLQEDRSLRSTSTFSQAPIPLDPSLWRHCSETTVPLVVSDTLQAADWAQSLLVTSAPGFRFYAGHPLLTREGFCLGVLCLLDTAPRVFTGDQVATLAQLAAVATAIAEVRQSTGRSSPSAPNQDQTATALRLVESRFQRIAESTSGMVYQVLHRADGTISFLFVSDACQSVLGVEKEALLADFNVHRQLLHPKDAPKFQKALDQAEADLSPLRWEGRHVLPDGQTRVLQITAQPQRAANGDILWDGVMLDVTERNRTAERLWMLESSIEHANDAILITQAEPVDEPGPRILYVNRSFTRATGYTEAEVLGKTPRLLQGPKTSPETKKQIRDALKAWEPVRVELINYRKDGTEFWVELNIMPVANAKGWYTHWVSVQRDITERKLIETALRDTTHKAEVALAEAERANQAKSEFLSRMSHELRTPLNAILGFGQLLNRSVLTERQKKNVSYVLSGGRHLLDLINEVLDIARIEAGRLELNLEAVHVATVLEEVIALVRPLAQRLQVTLNISQAEQDLNGAAITADRQRLKQVLLNLLSNAINYNRPSGRVDVLVVHASAPGFLRLSVRDTGRGMSPEDLLKLFSPFERLHARDSEVTGTGIGLAISKRLLEAMGGTIAVESEINRGSTFSIELPLVNGLALPLPPLSSETEAAGTAADANLPTRTILYIEDNLSNLLLVEEVLLERPDLKLISSLEALSGLERAREAQPDLILLDVHLPDLPGDSLLRMLKEDARTRDIPVIMVSADATPIQIERLHAAGAANYLTKPLDLVGFFHAIDEVLAEPAGSL